LGEAFVPFAPTRGEAGGRLRAEGSFNPITVLEDTAVLCVGCGAGRVVIGCGAGAGFAAAAGVAGGAAGFGNALVVVSGAGAAGFGAGLCSTTT
jgi:hypothetical protein